MSILTACQRMSFSNGPQRGGWSTSAPAVHRKGGRVENISLTYAVLQCDKHHDTQTVITKLLGAYGCS